MDLPHGVRPAGRLYVGSDDGWVYCLSATDGNVIWKFRAAPLAYEGRMFCCTYNDVSAYDVYTGTRHWTYPLKNAVRAHLADVPSNVAIGPEGYFVAVEDICYRLDPTTGKLLGHYKVPDAAPGQRRMWGYVALVDGVLVGSRTLGYLPMEKWRKSRGEQVSWWLLSDLLFAMDAQTGKVLWQYQTEWFRHNSVVTSQSKDAQAGDVFVSHPGGTPQQQQEAIIETKPRIDAYPEKEKARVQKIMEKPYVELLSALDLKTGKPRWQKTVDWTVCGGDRGTLTFDNINVTDDLTVELATKSGDPLLWGLQVTQVP